jgi:predicted site-specific integrase-resolvase
LRCPLRPGSDQKKDLERQLERLRDFASANGFHVVKEVTEVGSGLNGRRKKMLNILSDPKIGLVVVEHRDRLARFGSEYISAVLVASNRELCIMNETECNDDLVQDMVDVLTSFCARLYGRRSAKNKAKKAMDAIQKDNKTPM